MQGMPRLLSHDMWRRRERITRSRRLFMGISLLGATARNQNHPQSGWFALAL